ncbi:hypothetical protein SPI_07890 [Niveomyces insectorum RCEF 264]|uniref:Uncharacterized protein n=1 Tax=Niveomyces insectorum RCEF 264 TaxID=1081102 RepID=A0A167P4H3_9HYPO|nr:hypothetical protein SPI_07890 [Niveomyces insectorum RCEF 264]
MLSVTNVSLKSVLLWTAHMLGQSPKYTLRSPKVCYDGESTKLLCYTEANGGTPQNINTADVLAVASYLRSYGREIPAGRLFTMNTAGSEDCPEWSLSSNGTVLALAKHINAAANSSVLFEDIATTIDGGLPATAIGIISCLGSGGSLGVLVNQSNPAYSSLSYLASGATSDGILIKIVKS